jgi:hypothetical protein
MEDSSISSSCKGEMINRIENSQGLTGLSCECKNGYLLTFCSAYRSNSLEHVEENDHNGFVPLIRYYILRIMDKSIK